MRLGTVLAGFFALVLAVAVLIRVTNIGRSAAVVESGDVAVDLDGDQVYGSNPFKDEHPSPPPRVEIEQTEYDFDRIALGESQSHTFVVRNAGDGALKLAQGPSSCKCTVGKLGLDVVPPGESAEIELEWTPTTEDPTFSQSATIYTNDPEQPEFALRVQGVVANRITTFPGDTWTMTAVAENSPTSFEFVVVSQLFDEFEITGIETSSNLVHVDVVALPEEELGAFRSARSGYRLNGRLEPGFPVGDIREHLIVSTDVEQHEQIRLQIRATRIGPYNVVGPGWHAARKLLRMGIFNAKDGKSVRLSFFVEEQGDEFQFTDLRVEPPVLDVSWEVDTGFQSPTRKRIWIDVVAPPGMTPNRWVAEDPISVTLATNHPEAPEWAFFVSLQAN